MNTTNCNTKTKIYSIANFTSNDSFNIEIYEHEYICEDGYSTASKFALNEAYDMFLLRENQEVEVLNFNDCSSIEDCVNKLQRYTKNKLEYKFEEEYCLGSAQVCFYCDHKLFSCKDFQVNSTSEYDVLTVVALRCGLTYDVIKDIESVDKLIEVIEPHLVSHLVDKLVTEKRIEENSDNYYLNALNGGLFVQIKD